MADGKEENKQRKPLKSSDLIDLPKKNVSFTSKLLLSEQTRQAKGPPKTFKLQKSSVLGKVQCFLPLMAEADQKLKQDIASLPPGTLDIENIKDDEAHIEMSLAVVENDSSEEDHLSIDSELSSSEDETSSEEIKTECITCGPVTEKNIIITKRKTRKPVIQLLDNGDSGQTNSNNSFE